jgi:hypothetical protein
MRTILLSHLHGIRRLILHTSQHRTVQYQYVLRILIVTAVVVHRQHVVLTILQSMVRIYVDLVFYVRFWNHVTILHMNVHQIVLYASSIHVVHHKQCVYRYP